MRRSRWFLPETPDVLGVLQRQLALTIDGVDAFAAWAAGGDPAAAERLREADRQGDLAKRELLNVLRAALVTPLEPEDVFTLSRGLDRILNYSRDLVNEAHAMDSPPDAGIAQMARLIADAMRQIDAAVGHLGSDPDAATSSADAAIAKVRETERAYYDGMAGLLSVADRTERIAQRELYRRCARIGEVAADVAERVVYAVVKQS